MPRCEISAQMTTDKCMALRSSHLSCRTCAGLFSHTVILDLQADVYEKLKQLADHDGKTVAEAIQWLLENGLEIKRVELPERTMKAYGKRTEK